MVRATDENRLISAHVVADWNGSMTGLANHIETQVSLVVKVDHSVGQALPIESPLRQSAVRTDRLGEEEEVCLAFFKQLLELLQSLQPPVSLQRLRLRPNRLRRHRHRIVLQEPYRSHRGR